MRPRQDGADEAVTRGEREWDKSATTRPDGSALAEDDLPVVAREEDPNDSRRAGLDGNRQPMLAEPRRKLIGVTLDLQAREPDGARRMRDRRLTWESRASPPLDEERQGLLGGRALDARRPPGEQPATWLGSRTGANREAEPRSDVVQPLSAHGPPERPRDCPARGRDPASEGALLGLRLVDDREQLEIGPAERDDSVGGAPARVTTAFEGGQPVQRFELAGG